jgi:NTE family protein
MDKMNGSDCENRRVALGGGFFRGIAHIGVLQVLEENDIPIHMLAGTSMGAVIGSNLCHRHEPVQARAACLACNERMFFDIGVPRQGFIKGAKVISFMKTVTGDRNL